MNKLKLSTLNHTWILDLDGTLMKHNGYLNGKDEILNGTKEFIEKIPKEDYILILTARPDTEKEATLKFLKENKIRYNEIIFNIPTGERILINDSKPSGLICAHSINLKRDEGPLNITCEIDNSI